MATDPRTSWMLPARKGDDVLFGRKSRALGLAIRHRPDRVLVGTAARIIGQALTQEGQK